MFTNARTSRDGIIVLISVNIIMRSPVVFGEVEFQILLRQLQSDNVGGGKWGD